MGTAQEPSTASPACSVAALVTFGGGPRQCIGLQFAMMEMQLALAMIVPHHRVRLEPRHQVEAIPRFTLQPKGGLPVRLEKT